MKKKRLFITDTKPRKNNFYPDRELVLLNDSDYAVTFFSFDNKKKCYNVYSFDTKSIPEELEYEYFENGYQKYFKPIVSFKKDDDVLFSSITLLGYDIDEAYLIYEKMQQDCFNISFLDLPLFNTNGYSIIDNIEKELYDSIHTEIKNSTKNDFSQIKLKKHFDIFNQKVKKKIFASIYRQYINLLEYKTLSEIHKKRIGENTRKLWKTQPEKMGRKAGLGYTDLEVEAKIKLLKMSKAFGGKTKDTEIVHKCHASIAQLKRYKKELLNNYKNNYDGQDISVFVENETIKLNQQKKNLIKMKKWSLGDE